MSDPHRKPDARDRDAVVARIRRAADDGRISTADRDIRIANVASAQSTAELDLIARDLDQLEATISAAPEAPASPAPSPNPVLPVAEELADHTVQAAKATVRSIGVVTALILALVVGIGGAVVFFTSSSSSDSGSELFEPEPVPGDGEPVGDPSTSAGPATRYALNAAGVRSLVDGYRATFSTTLVVSLTMYDDYAVVQVPQAGTRRHASFVFRNRDGWSDAGGVSTNFPGTRPVDVADLDVAALMRNIRRARATLNVEDPSSTYVNIDYRSQFDAAPNVNIYVSNEYHESGYLATTLDGTVERAYPFDPQ